jgi:HEAT repeat-containing protein 5
MKKCWFFLLSLLKTGISSVRIKILFNFNMNLVRTSTKSIVGQEQSMIPRLLLQRIHTAWHLLAACCSLDQQYLKPFLPHFVRLWHNVFPRSSMELEQERQRGDSFTWTLSLNQRSDALCAMIAFLNHSCMKRNNVVRDQLLEHMFEPIRSAIVILVHLPNLIKHVGVQLKGPAIMYRLRLYQLLVLIPIDAYEQYTKVLLRITTTEFTSPDNPLNTTTTSLLESMYHENERFLVGKSMKQ